MSEKTISVPVEEFHALLQEIGEVKKHIDATLEIVKQTLAKIDRQAQQEAR
jgi:hypothetical protein